MNTEPYALAFRVNFAGTSLAGATAWAVSKAFWAALAADKGGVTENTFTAALTSEQGHLDQVFQDEYKLGKSSACRGKGLLIIGDKVESRCFLAHSFLHNVPSGSKNGCSKKFSISIYLPLINQVIDNKMSL